MSKATEYAARVLAGQTPLMPQAERMRRVQKALAGQGLELEDPSRFYGKVAFDSVTLQLALAAFNAGGTQQERVERVSHVVGGIGADLRAVLGATKRYMSLKTRKARKARLHS